MKVLVLGSTGGSGAAAVEQLLAEGHEVTAFTRRAVGADETHAAERLRFVQGDAMSPQDVERAVPGHDAIVVALGIRENPIRVRLFGPARTPLDVRSAGTRNVIAAMRKHGLKKLIVQTTFGVGATRDKLRFVDRLFFEVLLKPQILDTERQDSDVANSGLDYVLVQPVHLTDAEEDAMPHISTTGEIGQSSVSRNSVGRFLAHAVRSDEFVGKSVALSGHAC